MAIGANVSPFLTIGGVPVTLQLMFAILAGGILGSRLGALSMIAYILLGLAGAPVFAQFKGGMAHILSPTFGFVISFVVVAYAVGKIFENKKAAEKLHIAGAGLLSIVLNYLIGTNFMYMALKIWADAPDHFSYITAWGWMLAYLPLDIAVTAVSLAVLLRLKKTLKTPYSSVTGAQ